MEYEYGWNDPPTFSYSSSQAAAGKQTALTKRPSHPPPSVLSSQPNDPPLHPPPDLSCLPPSGDPCPPPPTTSNLAASKLDRRKTADKEERESCAYDQVDFADVIQRLNQLVDDNQDKLQKRVCDDIKRRLGILAQQVKEEKISAAVKLKTGRLLAAIEAGDRDEAEGIQVGMMVDHVSEVSQWLVAIKKLIAVHKATES